MNGLDYAVVAAVTLGAFYGLSSGAIRMTTSVAALAGAIYVASVYYPRAAGLAQSQLNVSPSSSAVLGYALLFAIVFVIVEFAGRSLMRLLRVAHLSWIDRLAGSMLAGAIAATMMGIAISIMAAVFPTDSPMLRESQLAPRLLLYNHELVRCIPSELTAAYEQKRGELLRYWTENEARLAREAASQSSPEATNAR
ncbi:MAG TPA: CvpA family protein [Candidatus Binataceae bacterium]|nr:CvpA family protein [Candidatus Binataceae bacterium]